ncbi:DinB family protein [Breznakiella homolactica]|uniref:DinB family protein n=1 Tax=Breznakiella homolactica TaxID=2798577 RepID=A0A7T8BB48_9SPIR|nr:DinB family protein [Breznakiella homolactica]QQO10187.1 DinB family protein [Breznakiella homolactica]
MKELALKQFEQFYRMFTCMVNDYDDEAWYTMGHKKTTAYILAFHIIDSTKFYLRDDSAFELENGETITVEGPVPAQKISRADILKNITLQKAAMEKWIHEIDFKAPQTEFPWTGPDMESVVIFIIRHNTFHLGEFNALLNEYKKGDAKDNFGDNIY